jgi:hypothetical protein
MAPSAFRTFLTCPSSPWKSTTSYLATRKS